MRLLTILTLAATAIAFPANSLQEPDIATIASDLCKLPEPGKNCADVELKDVIVQYGKATKEQRQLIQDVAKSAGSQIVHDYKDFGFSGFVPGPLVEMFKSYGDQHDLTVYENACAEIPWCGEAPC